MKKKNKKKKYLKYLLILMVSIIVAPLTSFAKSVNVEEASPVVLEFPSREGVSFEGISFDYWYIKDESIIPRDISEQISLANKFDQMSQDEIDKNLGTKRNKSNKTVKVSDDMATLTIEGLEDGYYLFKLDDESFDKLEKFTIPAFFLKVDKEMDNISPKVNIPGISMTKVDEDDVSIKLSGVVFKLFEVGKDDPLEVIKLETGKYKIVSSEDMDQDDPDKDKVTTDLITGNDGRIEVRNLKRYKKYYFKEIKTKSGYELRSDKSAEMSPGDDIIITNKKIPSAGGRYKFIKVDKENHKKVLEGAKFMVAKLDEESGTYIKVKDGEGDYILVSDEKGEFVSKTLPKGKYILLEMTAPDGYKRSKKPIEFEIKDGIEQGYIGVDLVENEKTPPPKGPPDNPPEGSSENPPENTPKGPPENSSGNPSNSPPKNPPENPPKDPPEDPPQTPPEGSPGNPPSKPPASPPGNSSTKTPSSSRPPIVKTGDIRIFIFLIAGLIFIGLGISLFKKDKEIN